MKFSVYTFGCKVNQYESAQIIETLVSDGWLWCQDWIDSDIVIVNGCAVTERAEKKSASFSKRVRAEGKRVILIGCAATSLINQGKEIPGIVLLPQSEKWRLPSILGLKTKKLVKTVSSFADRVRCFVKLQDGCDRMCSYCYIPYLRGRPYLRDTTEVKDELQKLKDSGYKEVVFTGICLGWGDQDIVSLAEYAKGIGFERVRLSSIEPFAVDGRILFAIRDGIICNFLHIPFQSGSNTILKLMNRKYTAKDYLAIVDRVRKISPDIGLSTDIMVGFPGETDEYFYETVEFLKKIRPMRMHIFPFSLRPKILARNLRGFVDEKTKEERVSILLNMRKEFMRQYIKSKIGERLLVLFEEERNGLWEGWSEEYIRVYLRSELNLKGRIKQVVIKDEDGGADLITD